MFGNSYAKSYKRTHQSCKKEIVLTEHANEGREHFEIPGNMIVYYLRLLKRGPLWTPEETPEIERLQTAHLAYGQKLREAGKLILNGPVIDQGAAGGRYLSRQFAEGSPGAFRCRSIGSGWPANLRTASLDDLQRSLARRDDGIEKIIKQSQGGLHGHRR